MECHRLAAAVAAAVATYWHLEAAAVTRQSTAATKRAKEPSWTHIYCIKSKRFCSIKKIKPAVMEAAIMAATAFHSPAMDHRQAAICHHRHPMAFQVRAQHALLEFVSVIQCGIEFDLWSGSGEAFWLRNGQITTVFSVNLIVVYYCLIHSLLSDSLGSHPFVHFFNKKKYFPSNRSHSTRHSSSPIPPIGGSSISIVWRTSTVPIVRSARPVPFVQRTSSTIALVRRPIIVPILLRASSIAILWLASTFNQHQLRTTAKRIFASGIAPQS